VHAIVDGYCQHHLLRSAELERIADAIRFRAIIYGAASFAAIVREGRAEDEEQWWWRRYTAADEIADRACQRFARYG
jgi:Ser/Thr protein kinase RdoA (MazF antagonist)